MSIEQQINDIGWWIEKSYDHQNDVSYRAVQGKFITPWRESSEQVLADLRDMKRKDAEAEKV